MSKTIVYDGRNIMLQAGTGIATYSRLTAGIARELGYQTQLLVSTNGFVRGGARNLGEVALFDALTNQKSNPLHRNWLKACWLMGAPLGVKPVAIRRSGAVHGGIDRLEGFDVAHASASLFDVAYMHFMRHGRRLDVKLEHRPDLFHATHATPIKVARCPNIYTIHDLVPLRAPQTTMEHKGFYQKLMHDLCRQADHILTVSEFSRADIMQLTGIAPDRITNTYQAVELPREHLERPQAEVADELERCFQIGFGEYFLFVGALEPKKNLERLIEAYASSGSKYPLIIAGGLGWQYEGILKAIRNERFLRYVIVDNEVSIRRKVRRVDYVPLSRLVSLYRGARAFLFPSIYEGFGLPVAEAMLAGAPVMTSNTTSLAEIAGDAALLVDPTDVDAMALAIRRLDSDVDLRAELARRGRARAATFDRQSYAERLRGIYQRLA